MEILSILSATLAVIVGILAFVLNPSNPNHTKIFYSIVGLTFLFMGIVALNNLL